MTPAQAFHGMSALELFNKRQDLAELLAEFAQQVDPKFSDMDRARNFAEHLLSRGYLPR